MSSLLMMPSNLSILSFLYLQLLDQCLSHRWFSVDTYRLTDLCSWETSKHHLGNSHVWSRSLEEESLVSTAPKYCFGIFFLMTSWAAVYLLFSYNLSIQKGCRLERCPLSGTIAVLSLDHLPTVPSSTEENKRNCSGVMKVAESFLPPSILGM